MAGSRRVFGVAVEKKVVVLVDTSGSMMPHMEELKSELVSLIWEQLFHHRVKYVTLIYTT